MSTGTVLGTHNMSRRNDIGQFVDYRVVSSATSSHFLAYHFSGKERYVGSVKTEVGKKILIHLLHLLWPVLLAGVGLSLKHKHTFYNALLLGFLCQLHEAGIGIVVVVFCHVLHPLRLFLKV